MKTINLNNQEEQVNDLNVLDTNYQENAADYNEPGNDAANQDDYPETEDDDLIDDDDELTDDTIDDDYDLTDDDTLDDDDLTIEEDDDDESANDADGNGGYADTTTRA